MVYFPILDHIENVDDDRIYTVTFTYFFHSSLGLWVYQIAGRKFKYGGVLPVDKLREFFTMFEHTVSGHVHSFRGTELKDLLKKVGEYIDYYGT